MEKLSVVHLTGPRRGQVDLLEAVPATLGSEPGLEVVIPGAAPRHAVIEVRNADMVLRDAGSGEGTFLAGQPVQTAVLRDGDVLELGSGGPTLRFHREQDRQRLRAPWLRAAYREVVVGTSLEFRLVVLMILLMATAIIVRNQRQARRLERQLVELGATVRGAEAERRSFEERVQAQRRRAERDRRALEEKVEEYRRREEELRGRLAEAARGEVRGLKDQLQSTRERLQTIESERAAGESIIRDYGAGVCLIQGSYAYDDEQGRPARSHPDDMGRPHRDEEGNTIYDADGTGPVLSIDYFGTGFLVEARGWILTNRHVAEPWRDEDLTERLAKAGFKPRFIAFRAFFPRVKPPFELHPDRQLEAVDLALLKVNLAGRKIPTLPLDQTGKGAVAGQPVVVVGYPTGLEAILAKADSRVVQDILERQGTGSGLITEALSQGGLIRPSTTQGHIGDITRTDIVFDAPTTQGGSGGPVFNKSGRVIAVEYAVLQKFGGNSFGVPIRYALELLRPPRKKGSG